MRLLPWRRPKDERVTDDLQWINSLTADGSPWVDDSPEEGIVAADEPTPDN